MKKYICYILIALLLLSAIPVQAAETEFSGYCGADPNYESVTWEVNPDTGVLSITGTGPMYMYTSSPPWCYPDIQDYITSAVVSPGITRLPSQCFGGLENLKSVSLPEGITQVGRRAFYGCTQLEEVDFPDTVQIMYGEVFEQCPSLRRVHLSESLQYLCDELFYNCAALEEVNIPPNITRIYSGCFTGCELLQSVHIPASVETIGSAAFAGCTSLRTITFEPDGKLESIGENAFSETAVESLELPWFLSDIGDYAFAWCKNLTSVTLPVYLQNIGADAFYSCCELESIMIPATVTQIGNYAFSGCESMQKITFEGGSRLQTIGERAFDDCRSLPELTLPMTVTSIGEYAFCNCDLLKTITLPGLMEDLSCNLFSSCEGLEEVILPVNLKTIDEGAFRWCENLKTITIPKGLHTVQQTVFYDCENLQTVYYGGSESDWNKIFISSGNNPLLNADRYYNNYPYVFDYEKMNVATFMYNLKIRDNGALLDGGSSLSDAVDNAFDRITDVDVYSGSTLLATTSDKAEFAVTDIVSADMILQKEGYRDYIIPVEVLRAVLDDCGDVAHNQTAYMTKDSKDGAYISTVFARETGGVCHKEVQKDELQILRDKEYEFVVSVGGLQTDEIVTEYCIKQENSSFKATSQNGIFTLADLHGKLASDLPVLVYAKTNKGQTDPVEIKLEKLNDDVSDWVETLSESSEYSFFGKDFMAVTIPESVPFVGGTKLSLDAFEFPFGAKVKGNQIYMSFGFDFFEKSKEDDGEWKSEWRGVKSTLKDYNKNVTKTKDAWSDFLKMKDNKALQDGVDVVADSTTNVGFNVGFLGFAEAEISNNGVQFTEVGITLAISFKASYSVQAMVWVVPCYFTLEGGLENTGLTVSGIDKTADPDVPLQMHVDLHLNPYIKVAGGVGIKQAISLGPYGKVVVDTDYAFKNKHLTMDVVGSLGVEWRVAFATGDDTLCEGTFDVIDKYFGKQRALQAYNTPHAIYDDGSAFATQAARTQQVTWYGASAAAVCKDTAQQLRILQQGGSISGMQLATVNNTLLAVWTDNGMLVYSLQSKNGTWTTPAVLAAGETVNMSPMLISNGERAVAVWQQIPAEITAADLQEAFFTKTEICMAAFDGNAFGDVQQLTHNTHYEYLPTAFFEGENAVVLWAENTANDLTAAAANNICKWKNGATQTVSANENYILSLAAGNATTAFVTDADGNLPDETDLTAVSLQNEARTTLPVQGALGVLFADDALLVHTADSIYTADGSLVTDELTGIPAVVSANGDTRIVWLSSGNKEQQLIETASKNGTWTSPACMLTFADAFSETAFALKNGTVCGIGKADKDFCSFAVSKVTDLALELLLVNEQNADAAHTASVYVRNKGTQPVTQFICALSDSLGTYCEYTQACSLAAGEGAWFDFAYTPSKELSETQLKATLYLAGAVDPTQDDNTKTHTVGCCDLLLEQVTCTQGDGYCTIEGTVRNDGSVTADKVLIALLSENGEQVQAVQTVDSLATDEAIRFTLYAANEQLAKAGGWKLLLTSSTAELYTDNNEHPLSVGKSTLVAVQYGDVDADGIIGAGDARLALRNSAGLEELTEQQRLAADVDKNGSVTAGDARLILRNAVGLYDSAWPTD